MPLVRFEPAVPAGERPQTYAVDRVAARIGWNETARMNTADTMGWITVTVAMVLPCSGWWGWGDDYRGRPGQRSPSGGNINMYFLNEKRRYSVLNTL